MHSAPVTKEIMLIITKDKSTRITPNMPKVKAPLALSSFFGSPPEFMYVNPPRMKTERAKIPTNIKSALRKLEKTIGRQSRVATSSCPCAQSFHTLNII